MGVLLAQGDARLRNRSTAPGWLSSFAERPIRQHVGSHRQRRPFRIGFGGTIGFGGMPPRRPAPWWSAGSGSALRHEPSPPRPSAPFPPPNRKISAVVPRQRGPAVPHVVLPTGQATPPHGENARPVRALSHTAPVLHNWGIP